MKKFVYMFLFMLTCSCSFYSTKEVTLPNTEVKFLTSNENNIKYKLSISIPEGYKYKDTYSYRENYPVLYLLDPDVDFPQAENIARTLVNYGTIEPFIIVGIGYQDQDLSKMDPKMFWNQWTLNRARDYVPFQVKKSKDEFEGNDHEYTGLAKFTGGSEKFKSFIEKELIPYIDMSYRTSNEHALAGHSQGGLFTTWLMINYTTIFQKYLILSPSLWIEKEQLVQQYKELNNKDEIKAYFAVGSLEFDSNGSMVDNLKSLYLSLPKNKKFESKLDILNDENHVSMVPAGYTKGFKFLFSK